MSIALKPSEIVARLNEHVIGQETAKKTLAVAVYGHFRRMAGRTPDSVELTKSNILLIGPTGTGKTLLCETLARILDLPFVTADATSLAQTQFVGDEIEAILHRLLDRAGGDIGKALTHEQEGSHALIGAELCEKYGETEIVRNAVAAHHNEEPQNSVIAHLVIAADALSGARPGARREILSTYIKRLEDLERISMSFEGVEKTYAIQAGREIRVMVQNSKVDDDQAFVLSREIARRIEDELTYPGQIRVTVIRETRAVEIAR
ncbi:MAG: HDIG domain-containing protein [Dechloromonas sp.]|nr:HDIG domain-containing protein [Dechloromonas sp.]